ncbi:hypothetical protein [Acetobacter pasteurianus]|uniref:hypothetical protein n=1 Tax=Acetobacter pasteurianus TaxID=438 RepID=UPI0003843459|nr:hypothetical protein [Acetobacter pasteurianus]CCT60398.1 hypothetical protein APA386B_2358 [Acetobacter pasteurianus 386B]
MVSQALRDLFSRDGDTFQISFLLKEIEDLGAHIVLADGQPVIRGDRSIISPDLLARLKEGRALIIEHLREQAAHSPERAEGIEQERSGIRKDMETGKLHVFGNPSSQWLMAQGWEWDKHRRRFMAPYPFDREDPHPSCMIGGGPKLPDDYPELMFEPQNVQAA